MNIACQIIGHKWIIKPNGIMECEKCSDKKIKGKMISVDYGHSTSELIDLEIDLK